MGKYCIKYGKGKGLTVGLLCVQRIIIKNQRRQIND